MTWVVWQCMKGIEGDLRSCVRNGRFVEREVGGGWRGIYHKGHGGYVVGEDQRERERD